MRTPTIWSIEARMGPSLLTISRPHNLLRASPTAHVLQGGTILRRWLGLAELDGRGLQLSWALCVCVNAEGKFWREPTTARDEDSRREGREQPQA